MGCAELNQEEHEFEMARRLVRVRKDDFFRRSSTPRGGQCGEAIGRLVAAYGAAIIQEMNHESGARL